MKKVLIVEDEAILRKGIATLIDWNGLGFDVSGQCNNGLEALNHLKMNKVDLVISDIKMPLMNGLELTENIKVLFPSISIILLTAYSDFQFTQQAIRLGVDDYVLKKDFVKSLPKAVKILMDKSIEKQLSIKSGTRAKLNHLFFKGILEGLIIDIDEIRNFLSDYSISNENFYVCAIEILKKDFTNNSERLDISSITTFLNSAIKDFPHYYSYFSPNYICMLIGSKKNGEPLQIKVVRSLFNQIGTALSSYTDYLFLAGISSNNLNISNIKEATQESILALGSISDNQTVVLYEDIAKKRVSSISINYYEISNRIAQMIILGKYEDLDFYITKLFKTFNNCNVPFPRIKANVIIISTLYLKHISKTINESSVLKKPIEQLILDIDNVFTSLSIYKLFSQTYYNQIEICSSLKSPSINRIVVQAYEFILENFHLPISLKDIANFLHVNSSYLSRIYKKEMDESIVTTINKLKIERAKELLASGKYLVSEAGTLVGIDDPAYFTKVFIQYAGHTPKQSMH